MRKLYYFLTLIFFAIFSLGINAATVLNIPAGTISSTNWDVDTVRVNGNITVASNQTLVIGSGTYVLFTGYYKLTVNGIIKANGALNDSIIFTRYQKTSDTAGFTNFANTNGAWAGIEINSFNSSDSTVLRFCRIEFIKNTEDYPKGIKFLSGKSFSLKRSVYRNNLGCIYANGVSGLYIDTCKFSKNNNYKYPTSDWNSRCIEVFTWNVSNLYIQNNNIWSSSSTALRIYRGSNVVIRNNTFTGDKKADNYSDLTTFLSLENASSTVSKNTFIKKNGSPLGINVDGGYAIIDSNSIAKVITAFYLKSSASGKVRGNTIDTCTTGINSSSSFFNISNNKITGCTGQAAFFHAFCIDTLDNNTFKNNVKAIEFNQSNALIINTIVANSSMYAITFNKSNIDIVNCLIANNSGNQYGCAINAQYSTTNITNSTIVNNADLAATNAPVSFVSSGGDVKNTIIYGNKANSVIKQVSITDNDIQPSFYSCDI